MRGQIILFIICFSLFNIACPSMSYSSQTNTQTNSSSQSYQQEIDHLQNEINELKAAKKQEKKKVIAAKKSKSVTVKNNPSATFDQPIPTCTISESVYNPQRVIVGDYINADTLYNGSDLIINIPSVREAARLLLRQVSVDQECSKLGIPFPKFPRLVFSGNLAGQYVSSETYTGANINNINFSSAEL